MPSHPNTRAVARWALAALIGWTASSSAGQSACQAMGGFPVYQCGDRAFFREPPAGSGSVKAVFWQIGFGNRVINNAEGNGGAGIAPPGVFSGNDSGLLHVPLISAAPLLDPGGGVGVPLDALCLGPINWASRDVDGCCDNPRFAGASGQDGWLNPNFDPSLMTREGRFVPEKAGMVDHPMAVLLREETGQWLAVAFVASHERPADHADIRAGHYTLADVADGEVNPLTGARNVVPWQPLPRIRLEEEASPGERHRFRASWEPVRAYSDLSRRPSGEDGAAPDGVGVLDMGSLVAYGLERARLFPEMVSDQGLPVREVLLWERLLTTEETSGALDVGEDECARVVVLLGRRPATPSIGPLPCGQGLCGDVGYEIPGPALCVEGPLLRRSRSRD